MRKIIAIAALTILGGCASQPMTPFQQQVLMNYMQSQQNNYNQQMANIRATAPTTCVSNVNGNYVYTTCQ